MLPFTGVRRAGLRYLEVAEPHEESHRTERREHTRPAGAPLHQFPPGPAVAAVLAVLFAPDASVVVVVVVGEAGRVVVVERKNM